MTTREILEWITNVIICKRLEVKGKMSTFQLVLRKAGRISPARLAWFLLVDMVTNRSAERMCG